MREANYDKFPVTKVDGTMLKGWQTTIDYLQQILNQGKTIAIDTYVGVHDREITAALKLIQPSSDIIQTKDLFKSEREIDELTRSFLTEDVLFGYVTNLELNDYFDPLLLAEAQKITKTTPSVIYGWGAAIVAPADAIIVYVDMARWEIIQRMRQKSVSALGIDKRDEEYSHQYKRGYFNDWLILDKYKTDIYERIDFWIDTHVPNNPKMIDKKTFLQGIEKTVNRPFRVVPFFDTAPWGGQWMKDVCDLDRSKINYGWCFDCVPEENSLLFEIDGDTFEMPSLNLVKLKSRELLGEPVESRFGKEFPIRFDFLDTFEGGNLSLQVHPTTQFIRDSFGMYYTQDESYYMIDAKPGAVVYLGLKNDIDQKAMIEDLKKAESGEAVFDAEKYVNKIPAKKHDHFLIPGGTIHCSGPQGLVLEISSTPNLFTFKLWDWERLGLDGKPRPINVDRGSKVLNWERNTDYTLEHLVNVFSVVNEGDGWIEEKTGLHKNEFIETRRHRFTKKVAHKTNDSVNVLNLVEGEEVIIESPTKAFAPFIVHYAETFIVPAHLGEYTITPYGKSEGKECITIKAFIRFRS